ncbi:MAG: YifB family Mg chelatase-like AAA ATPase [Steroidobacteraceae bacterium]|jgi:magnesium chelatase family protein|nr:YifB family Mg chelatase-like AAA ATPase [Steroidobacteraceae bacterium]
MGIAIVLSRAQQGMAAPRVRVEVDIGAGLPRFTIVGLPEAVVKESKDRVRAAITNSGFSFPDGRVTVNLSPAELPKEGGRFDLPIALAMLLASEQLRGVDLGGCEFYGELSLTGELRPMRGALLVAAAAVRADAPIIAPLENAFELGLVANCRYAVASRLLDVAAHVSGNQPLEFLSGAPPPPAVGAYADLNEVRGQTQAKRALEVAAAGEHSLLMIGPPGAGKSMLAQRLPGLLPLMSEAEALEAAAVRSAAGLSIDPALWRVRPFRSPHHSASAVALVGGGSHPRPGEISLAHQGVLFLDELPEFDRRALEALREPLETGIVTVSRAARQAEFPACFQLIAAMNPCPCGYLGDGRRCKCTSEAVARYRSRLSGPLLDRLDLHIEAPRLAIETLSKRDSPEAEPSAAVARRVIAARTVQYARQGAANARLNNREVERYCQPTRAGLALLERASGALGLSARAFHRVLKVARTIADLGGAEAIDVAHVGEAMALRRLDRLEG